MVDKTYDDVEPTEGDVAMSYEWMFDVAAKPATSGGALVWINIADITALNPQFAAQLTDIATYAHKGQSAQTKTGSTFTLSFNLLKIRDLQGEFQPEFLILKEASDKNGSENELHFRYYDGGGASDAYQGKATVQRDARPETGNSAPGWEAFTLNGSGRVLPIANPLKDGA